MLFGTDTPMDMAAPGSFTETSKEGVLKSGKEGGREGGVRCKICISVSPKGM